MRKFLFFIFLIHSFNSSGMCKGLNSFCSIAKLSFQVAQPVIQKYKNEIVTASAVIVALWAMKIFLSDHYHEYKRNLHRHEKNELEERISELEGQLSEEIDEGIERDIQSHREKQVLIEEVEMTTRELDQIEKALRRQQKNLDRRERVIQAREKKVKDEEARVQALAEQQQVDHYSMII